MIWCALSNRLPAKEIGRSRRCMTTGLDRHCLVACLLLVSIGSAHAGDGVIVIQESNGFPGGEKAGAGGASQVLSDQLELHWRRFETECEC